MSLVNMTFHLEWNPIAYISDLGFQSSSVHILDKVLCLTGTYCEAQAMTVSEYIRQTWPVTGEPIKSILQELITRSEGHKCTFTLPETKGAYMSAHLVSKELCAISVTAGTYFISELSEQIAWLASALRSSVQNEGVVACRPYIKSLSVRNASHADPTITTTRSCSFSFDYELEVQNYCNKGGSCWASLFRNPILRRLEPGTGLEMSLGTMACLVQSDQLVKYGERILLKGFNSLLVAVLAIRNVVLWHVLVGDMPGKRISYFDNRIDTLCLEQRGMPLLRMLESSRHIVGWCAKATDFCGHATANYTISASMLRPSSASIVIDRMYIEGGIQVIGGVNVRPNQKEQPIKLHQERDYPELLQMVAAHL